jgi:hypothetical protein
MPELTNSTREAARRIGVSDTAIYKAERAGRIAREPNGQWDIDKTRRRLTETADPNRSPLAVRDSAAEYEAATAHELAEQARLRETADFREGTLASRERRQPRFIGA